MAIGSVMHVIIQRDVWDWLGILVTIGVGLATIVAVGIAIRALGVAERARGDLVRERRMDFELSVLREVLDGVERDGYAYVRQSIGNARVRVLLPADDLSWLGHLAELQPNPAVRTECDDADAAAAREHNGKGRSLRQQRVRDELVAAIASRLERRPHVIAPVLLTRSDRLASTARRLVTAALRTPGLKQGDVVTITVDAEGGDHTIPDGLASRVADETGGSVGHTSGNSSFTVTVRVKNPPHSMNDEDRA